MSGVQAAEDLDALRARLAAEPGLRELGLGGVVIGAGVVTRVPALCAELIGASPADAVVAVLTDRRPMDGPGGELKAGIAAALTEAGLRPERVVVGDEAARPHADEATIAAAADAVRVAGARVIVSVGSGTVADIGKAVSARLDGLAHVIVQTAASVNGFADDQSVLLRDGVKRTTPTRWAQRLVIDTTVVARAPAELNRAGLGDLLATYTAPADWLLARAVGQDDSYSETVVALCRAHVDPVLAVAAQIGAGESAAIGELSAGLTLSGISMGVAGRTAPGSGMEHTVSHLLEMAHPPGRPEPWHGAKVGILSVLAALVWSRARERAPQWLAVLRCPEPAEMRSRVEEAFAGLDPSGAVARECWSDYARKLERWRAFVDADGPAALATGWAQLDATLGDLLASAPALAGALAAAGAPRRLSELGIEPDRARWALEHCHLMRDRFTVADLAFLAGGWEAGDVDEVLAEADALGVGL